MGRSRFGCRWGYRCKYRHERHLVQSSRATRALNIVFDDGVKASGDDVNNEPMQCTEVNEETNVDEGASVTETQQVSETTMIEIPDEMIDDDKEESMDTVE